MDSTIIAAIIGALSTIIAVLIPYWQNRIKRNKGKLIGTIEELFISSSDSNAFEVFRKYLPEAREIRLCGQTLSRIIDINRLDLSAFVQRGGELRLLLLDPDSSTTNELDSIFTHSDAIQRKIDGFPPVVPTQMAKNDLLRTIAQLKENNLLKFNNDTSQTLHLCKTLLPFSMIMIEKQDGSGWASILLYPLHPDLRFDKRYTFNFSDNKSKLWKDLKEQFDLAWEDPHLSPPFQNLS
jgi:hypothetical protein